MKPKPTTSNMSMVLPEERAIPFEGDGVGAGGSTALIDCAAWGWLAGKTRADRSKPFTKGGRRL